MASNVKRLTFSVSPEVAKDLREVSSFMGVSQSALVTELLGESLKPLREIITKTFPSQVLENTPEARLRARGASLDVISDRLNSFMHQLQLLEEGQPQ